MGSMSNVGGFLTFPCFSPPPGILSERRVLSRPSLRVKAFPSEERETALNHSEYKSKPQYARIKLKALAATKESRTPL